MKKLKKLTSLLFLFCCLCFCLILFPQTARAGSLTPTAQDNLNVRLRRTSDLIPVSGGYMRVFYQKNSVGVEYYDNDLKIRSKRKINMELPLWGGFYAGSDGYYLVEGQTNNQENDSAEVIRVIRYDTNWNRNGAAAITSNPELFGGEVRTPFDYGCVEMTESNGKLYVVTGHEGYVDSSVGQGHQGFLMVEIDQATMKGKIVSCDLWHSFAQYIKSQGSYLYVLEQSEGSRCTILSRYDSTTLACTTIELLPYGGSHTSVWALACYASVDGMAVSSDSVLCVGTSIDQSKYDKVSENTPHNLYLSVTPMSDFSEKATTTRKLTNFTGGGKSFAGVKITKINDNRFMISWEEYVSDDNKKNSSANDPLSSSTLHYLFVDGKGKSLSKEFTTAAPISDCQPVVKDSKVVYYASNSNTLNFYSINSDNGKADKKTYHIAGDNATWNFKNGILTISGYGPLSISTEENHRYPVSSTKGWFTFYSDSSWKAIKNQIRKVIIKPGITSISERAFVCLPELKEVDIQKGVSKIGKEAFAYCDKLSRINIPDTVKSIGTDAVWGGYGYVNSHAYFCKIHAPYGSYAVTYAKKNNISYACNISDAAVTGIKKTYTYTGSDIKPVPTVTLGKAKLSGINDYHVTYQNNKKAGTATLKIIGDYHFYGTITLNFQITPAATPKPQTAKTFRDAYNVYTVNTTGTSVALKGPRSRNTVTAKIPATVKANGKTYKVTAIAANAFKNCKNLKQVTISGNITSIGAGAFQGCTSLRTVKIGSRVSAIGTKAFCDCKALTSVTIQTGRLTSKSSGKYIFTRAGQNNYKKLTVKVPASRLSSYKKLFQSQGLSTQARVIK
ncbi:leucine-rich repeat domain-containing protein [Blautia sp.]|uniref:leucine-rich repeat domain-containing protein n=1 Tax=Blautia sp. TaxID=1955243 RepID=UPI00257B2C80|nr:leucine-rich repeat domain-containing protein [Blautia sp.]